MKQKTKKILSIILGILKVLLRHLATTRHPDPASETKQETNREPSA